MVISSVKVTVDGQEYPLSYNAASGKFEATLTAPTKSSGSNNSGIGIDIGANAQGLGYYPMSIEITDDAGNATTVDSDDATWGNLLRLMVLETTPPVAELIYPTSGAVLTDSQPTFEWTVTDEGSGVDPASCCIAIDGGTPTTVTPSVSGGVATCSYTPSSSLSGGSHTVEVYGSDFDGNVSTHVSATFTIDISAPALVITSPVDDIKTNVSQITLAGYTDPPSEDAVTLTVTVGSTVYTPTIESDGSFSQVIDLTEGVNSIVVVATDSSDLSTTVTRTVTVDTRAPVIVSITIVRNPAEAGTTYTIDVEAIDQ